MKYEKIAPNLRVKLDSDGDVWIHDGDEVIVDASCVPALRGWLNEVCPAEVKDKGDARYTLRKREGGD